MTAISVQKECLEFVEPLTPSTVNYASIEALSKMQENCRYMKVTAPVCSQICKLQKDMYAQRPTMEECEVLPEKFATECNNRNSGKIYYYWSGATIMHVTGVVSTSLLSFLYLF
jgi:hypothetical protein